MQAKSLLIIALLGISTLSYSQSMKKTYEKEVLAGLERTKNINRDILTETDIQHLPSDRKSVV